MILSMTFSSCSLSVSTNIFPYTTTCLLMTVYHNLSFSNALYGEYRHTGIKITLLCPGATETEFARKANIELQLYICSIINSMASSFDKSYAIKFTVTWYWFCKYNCCCSSFCLSSVQQVLSFPLHLTQFIPPQKHILCLFQMPFTENIDM